MIKVDPIFYSQTGADASMTVRTDLAAEAREIWQESAGAQTALQGVKAWDEQEDGYDLTFVEILDEQGVEALGKPVGLYVTIEVGALMRREEDAFTKGMTVLSRRLKQLLALEPFDHVLVVGLGNPEITPDRIGPLTARSTMVTNHLVEQAPEHFGGFRRVSVLKPGVLGTTGIESADVIKAVVQEIRPDKVVAVDALASRSMDRICRTVQICNTGIVPGSGVGNSRAAINQETMGVPVISVGVPTVVDAGTLAADLLRQAGLGDAEPEAFQFNGGSMIVTPKEIDVQVTDLSKLIGYSVNMALHEGLTLGDIDLFLS